MVGERKPVNEATTKEKRIASMASTCPTPTSGEKVERVAAYLERTKPDANLDVLATEWERLDDGARTCRTGKAPAVIP